MSWLAAGAAVLALRVFVATLLKLQGRLWWCKCGVYNWWNGEVHSMHNSQHIADPYSFSHFLHGVGTCWLLWVIPYFSALTMDWRFFYAVVTASMFELIENSKTVIARFRENTISLGYEGDSIANSISDTIACGAGFLFTEWLGFWPTASVVLLTELVMALWIRDNLILNTIMIVYPIDVIKNWQRADPKIKDRET